MRVVSLGAGVQSSTVLLMAVEGEITEPIEGQPGYRRTVRPDVAIFADTGWEPKRVYEYLAVLERIVDNRIPIIRVSKGNLRADSLRSKDGKTRCAALPFFVRSPLTGKAEGRLRRQCTREYKVEVITKQIRELLGVPKGVRVKERIQLWFGISAEEVYRVKDNRYKWIDNYYPLIDLGISRAGCLQWMADHHYPIPPKSSCIGCPYHDDGFWLDLREHYPDEWEDACQYDEAIRVGLKGVLQEAYLHRSLMPLRQVPLTPEEKAQYRRRVLDEAGQLHFLDFLEIDLGFAEECEGHCGV